MNKEKVVSSCCKSTRDSTSAGNLGENSNKNDDNGTTGTKTYAAMAKPSLVHVLTVIV